MSLGIRRAAALVALALCAVLALSGTANAHEERETKFPDGSGSVPAYRAPPAGNPLVVCRPESGKRIAAYPEGEVKDRNERLLDECRFDSIQDAVNAVETEKSTIYVLPGTYTEDKYANTRPEGECDLSGGKADPLGDATSYIGSLAPKSAVADPEEEGQPVAVSYADQYRCPHNLNLIAVMGDRTPENDSIHCDSPRCGLQIEGTGIKPEDVVIDNKFSKLNAIRADRVSGLYLRNFTVQQSEFNAVYVLESDGFVVDKVTARANDEYGVLAFSSDHGVVKNTDTYYNGDSGIYPGSASDVNADNDEFGHGPGMRYSIEVHGNDMHDNALGYSGTAGNSVHAHHNRIHDNLLGMATDSVFPGHPGMPQDHARWDNNKIWNNNRNYYKEYVHSGWCERPMEKRRYLEDGVVCPVIPMPVGTGVLIAGGNQNLVEDNQIWGNWRAGAMQLWAPAPVRDEFDPRKLYDTSNHNHWIGNEMGLGTDGDDKSDLNGLDFWWDDEGVGNCWEGNTSGYGKVRTNFVTAPASCEQGGSKFVPGTSVVKDSDFLTCIQYNRDDKVWRNPPNCSWFEDPKEPSKADGGGMQPLAAAGSGAESAVLAGVGVMVLMAVRIGRRAVRHRTRRGAA